jgi:hypothetical protein
MRPVVWAVGIVCAVVAVAGAWLMASSLMLIFIAALPEPIASPWTVWWFYASHGPNAWTKAYLFAAALLPTLFAVLCVFIVIRYRLSAGRALYGSSDWAAPGEMRTGGVRQSRSPF